MEDEEASRKKWKQLHLNNGYLKFGEYECVGSFYKNLLSFWLQTFLSPIFQMLQMLEAPRQK